SEKHRRGVVDAVVERSPKTLRVHAVDGPSEVEHGIDDVHAAPGHPAGRTFIALLAPMLALETIHTRPAEIAFDVQELPEAAVGLHPANFLQGGLEAPVVAHCD